MIIDPSAVAAPYGGNFFLILGGADGGTNTAFDDLADVPFTVAVQTPTTATPEPATFWLALGVLIAFIAGGSQYSRPPCPTFGRVGTAISRPRIPSRLSETHFGSILQQEVDIILVVGATGLLGSDFRGMQGSRRGDRKRGCFRRN